MPKFLFAILLSMTFIGTMSRSFAASPQTAIKTKPLKTKTPKVKVVKPVKKVLPVKLKVVTDRPNAIYKLGESVTFTITATEGGKPFADGEIFYIIDDYGRGRFPSGVYKKGKISLTGKPQTLTASLTKSPGFLRCQVVYRPKKGKLFKGVAGAAFAPLTIQPSTKTPDDFEQYWTAQKKKLAAVPMTVQLTDMKFSDKTKELYDIQIKSLGMPVSGYFAKPRDAKPKSLPIVLWVQGAGVRSSSLGTAMNGARNGFLSMEINAHGIPNGKPKKFYDDLKKGALKSYRFDGREDREKVYFNGMFLRIVRSLDFLTKQPEWDGKTVCVVGHSQGGAQALVAGGLDSRVTFIGAGVPAMCDHTGAAVERVSGWPKFVPVDGNKKPDPKVTEVSKYFDAVNFAKHFKGEAILSVGFCDHVCPPTSCYAAYNQIRGKKQIVNQPLRGHGATPDIHKAFLKAMKDHAAR